MFLAVNFMRDRHLPGFPWEWENIFTLSKHVSLVVGYKCGLPEEVCRKAAKEIQTQTPEPRAGRTARKN
jgi:hypothetical protein